MITKDGVRLLDFGVARRSQPATESTVAATRPGVVVGTVGYMSPEQVQGLDVDPRSDLFAVGVLLHEMVTGRPASSGGSDFSTMSAIVSQEPPPASSVRPEMPAAVEDLIARCLRKDPAARPASADVLLAQLRALESGARQVTFRRIHPAVAAGVALALLALAGVATWMWVRNARITRARTQLIPEIARRAETDTFSAYPVRRLPAGSAVSAHTAARHGGQRQRGRQRERRSPLHSGGGAWPEPPYMFHDYDARPPRERSATHGVRCARYEQPLAAELVAPIERRLAHDYSKDAPRPADVVDAYVRRFAYDPVPLDARMEQDVEKEDCGSRPYRSRRRTANACASGSTCQSAARRPTRRSSSSPGPMPKR